MTPITRPLKLDQGPFSKPIYSREVKLDSKQGETLFHLPSPKHIRGLIGLMDMQAVLGGAASHFGGPSAFAEINSALFGYIFSTTTKSKGKSWSDQYNLVNDAGHCENGIYALKSLYGFADLNLQSLKSFRSLDSRLTGHGEHHLFPEGVQLSNGPLGSSVAQAQGLAVADKFINNDRITILTISDGACMEGEAKEAFASIPGLAKQGKQNPFLMIISDNNTKLSGRIDQDAFSMKPTFESLTALGWKVVTVEDGHDLRTCLTEIKTALENIDSKQPWAIHFKTIKGYGHKSSVASSSGGHGFPLKKAEELDSFLKEIFQEEEIPKDYLAWVNELKNFKVEDKAHVYKSKTWSWLNDLKAEKIQVGVSKALIDAKEKGLPIVSVTSDLPGSTGVDGFRKKFPESCIDVGVAESNMVSLASGLSKNGIIPIVDTFAQFGVTKGALPITMGNLSMAPVIAFFSHTGFQDAADGASHQALSYFSMMASIPHTKVIALSSSEEAYHAVTEALEDFKSSLESDKHVCSYIFFLGRENFKPKYLNSSDYKLGQTQKIICSDNAKATVVAVGSMVEQAVIAADILEEKGIKINILNPLTVNELDLITINSQLQKSQGWLIVLEDHQTKAGFGYYLAGSLMEKFPNSVQKFNAIGVSGEFGQSAYTAQELYDKNEMGYTDLVKLLV